MKLAQDGHRPQLIEQIGLNIQQIGNCSRVARFEFW